MSDSELLVKKLIEELVANDDVRQKLSGNSIYNLANNHLAPFIQSHTEQISKRREIEAYMNGSRDELAVMPRETKSMMRYWRFRKQELDARRAELNKQLTDIEEGE